jgi:4-hydroxybenzoate polyprenyltransferase
MAREMHQTVARVGHEFYTALRHYARLMRLDRPIGIWLLLWPTLWSLWIAAQGRPRPEVFLVMVLGVVVMRSAGCVINDYADRDFDPHVTRTKDRPLAAGLVAPTEALVLFALLIAARALTLDPRATLAIVGAALAVSYPFMKRFFSLPQAWLGAAFGWAVPMAFAAQTGHVPATGWILFVTTLAWTIAYDTIYAMVDRDDDLRMRASSAILFGGHDRGIVGLLQVATVLGLAWVASRRALPLVLTRLGRRGPAVPAPAVADPQRDRPLLVAFLQPLDQSRCSSASRSIACSQVSILSARAKHVHDNEGKNEAPTRLDHG